MVKLSKLKRMEKAKVKLKLKAKKLLPKGQNVTDTSFKSRKIVIPGQLKSPNKGDIHTKKKLNVQELVSHLHHYNVSMRREGLSGLNELINLHKDEVINLHLPKVIDGTASLVLDIDSDIRKAALKLLELLFVVVPLEHITPHFNILRTYMSCAMTHIDSSIREDSLVLLDCLLNVCPLLMVKKADEVLPNFLNMVSNMRNETEHIRTLSTNVNKKVIGIRWRLKVFAKLVKYFSTIVLVRKGGVKGTNSLKDETTSEENLKVVIWNENSPLYAAEFMTFPKQICDLPQIFTYTNSSSENVGHSTGEHEKVMMEHVKSFLPILFEAWVEVAPEKGAQVNIISDEAAVMMQYVVETLQHIFECLQSWEEEANIEKLASWFIENYGKIITKAFLPGFPFSLQENVFKHSGKRQILKEEQSLTGSLTSISSKCTQQNLSLCYLFACIHDGKSGAVRNAVGGYLLKCIRNWDEMELLPILDKVLRKILHDQRYNWSGNKIIQILVEKCMSRSLSRELYSIFFSILCDYVIIPGSYTRFRNEEFGKWIYELPCTLFQTEVGIKSVKALSVLTSQNHKLFMDGLKRRSRTIIDSLLDISIKDCSSPLIGQKIIIDMLFHVADKQSLNNLLRKLSSSQEHQELASYVQNMIKLHDYLKL